MRLVKLYFTLFFIIFQVSGGVFAEALKPTPENVLERFRQAHEHKSERLWPEMAAHNPAPDFDAALIRFAQKGRCDDHFELESYYNLALHTSMQKREIHDRIDAAAGLYNVKALKEELEIVKKMFHLDKPSYSVSELEELAAQAYAAGNMRVYWHMRYDILMSAPSQERAEANERFLAELWRSECDFPLKKWIYADCLHTYSVYNKDVNKLAFHVKRITGSPVCGYYDNASLTAALVIGKELFGRGRFDEAAEYFLYIIENEDEVADRIAYDVTAITHLWSYLTEKGCTEDLSELFNYDFTGTHIIQTNKSRDDLHFYTIIRDYYNNKNTGTAAPLGETEFDADVFLRKLASEGPDRYPEELFFFENHYLPSQPYTERMKMADMLAGLQAGRKSKQLDDWAELLKLTTIKDIADQQEVEQKLDGLKQFAVRMEKSGNQAMYIKAIRAQMDLNYTVATMLRFLDGEWSVEAFRNARILANALKDADSEYPWRRNDYLALGELYSTFNDKERAVDYLTQAVSDSQYYYDPASMSAQLLLTRHLPDDKVAGHVHKIILCPENIRDREKFNHRAAAEMGISLAGSIYTHHLALGLFNTLLSVFTAEDDAETLWRIYARLAHIYLTQNDLERCGEAIDKAMAYKNSCGSVTDADFELVKSRYYLETGQMLKLNMQLWDQYKRDVGGSFLTIGIIRDAEQQIYESDIEVKNRKIRVQRRSFICVVIIGIAILGVATVFMRMYRKKHAAYKMLARKAEEWAAQSSPDIAESAKVEETTEAEPKDNPDYSALLDRIQELMGREKLYRDPNLSLTMLADRLRVSRNTLSDAVNSTTSQHFNRFINEYRIKEAVNILSSTTDERVLMEELIEQVGFNSSSPFYTAFKEYTGLSPSEFRKSRGK